MKQSRFLLGIVLSSCLFLFSCGSKTSINKAMQDSTLDLLKAEIKNSKIDSALVLITSVSTGEVLVKTKLFNDFAKGQITEASKEKFDVPFEPGLIVVPFTVMGAMDESGYFMSDQVDAGDGRLILNERTIYDDAVWQRGGYGFIELGQCITLPSNIGLVLILEDIYKGKREAFEKRMKAMSFGAPEEKSPFASVNNYPAAMNAFTLGSSFKLTPTQLATAWNGFANNGKMMKLTTNQGDTLTLNSSMNKPETLKAMNELLVTYAKNEYSKASNIAFYKSIYSVKNTYKQTVTGAFCGFYPADKPQYSCEVVLFYSAAPEADAKDIKYSIDMAGRSLFFSLASMRVE
jgi:cell division protein FtsI (penicillin-binding protein 3)